MRQPRKTPRPANARVVVGLRAKIEKCKQKIAAERDKLREYINEVQSIIEDCEEAESELQDAQRNIDRAVDRLSAYL